MKNPTTNKHELVMPKRIEGGISKSALLYLADKKKPKRCNSLVAACISIIQEMEFNRMNNYLLGL